MRTLREARRLCILLALADGKPRHLDEVVILNEDYTGVPRATRRVLLRELVAEGLVEVSRCPRDGRHRLYRLVPHPVETELLKGPHAADGWGREAP